MFGKLRSKRRGVGRLRAREVDIEDRREKCHGGHRVVQVERRRTE
jgi:hypothetical protein